MLQWLMVFKIIRCFVASFFLDGFSVKTVNGMLFNPLSGSWSWMESTSVNYAMHAVKSGVQGQSSQTEAVSEMESKQPSATAGTAV